MIYFVVGKYLLPYLKEIYVDKIVFKKEEFILLILPKVFLNENNNFNSFSRIL